MNVWKITVTHLDTSSEGVAGCLDSDTSHRKLQKKLRIENF